MEKSILNKYKSFSPFQKQDIWFLFIEWFLFACLLSTSAFSLCLSVYLDIQRNSQVGMTANAN
jgi:hypothetical protein